MKRFEYHYMFKNHYSKWIDTPSYYESFPVIRYLDNFKEAVSLVTDTKQGMVEYCHYLGLKKATGKFRTFDWKLKIYFYLLRRRLR